MTGTPLLGFLRRPASRRTAFTLLASSFVLVASSDLLGRHACPHHHPPDSAPAGHEHAHDLAPDLAHVGSGHDHHGHHHGGHHESHGTEDAAPRPHHDHDGAPCTCIGACHVSAATPLSATPSTSAAPGATAALTAEPPPARTPAVRLLPYVLPFPNGPPALG